MVVPFSGGCACGAVRYICASAPMAMLNCHCKDCQLSSGAPFASGLIVGVKAIQVTGNPSTYTVTAASGRETVRSFCGACGTPLFAQGKGLPVLSIRFPTLDDQTDFKPMLDIWTSRAPSWTCLDNDVPHFDTTPPSPADASTEPTADGAA